MVVETVRQRIATRALTPGARLPSVRGLARTLQVSTSTVVEAYDRLVGQGVIFARPGSGFFVASQTAPLALAELAPRRDRAVDPLWVSRQSLDAGDDMPKPGCGWLPPDWLPLDLVRKALRQLARTAPSNLTDYATPLGLTPLRQLIAQRLAGTGVAVAPDHILLTESGTQAIDLLLRFLIEPGDTVLLDDPCYFNFQALLRAHRANVVSVPYTATGPDLECFAKSLATHRPRLYITNSGIHNPTGATLSPVTAHRLLTLAEQHGLTIVEDDIFADFELTPAPRLAAFDGLDRVIQIGSFSKTISAAARCGFIAARPEWIDGLADLRIATSFGGGSLDAALVLAVLGDGGYRRHMEQLRLRLAGARIAVGAALAEIGIVPLHAPQAGMLLWCRLPDGRDAADLARAALDDNIVLAPGNVFSPAQSAADHMRFNVAHTDARTITALRRLLG